jgi:hypothetical protein
MDDYGFLITSGASSDSEEDQHYYLLNNKAEIVGILRPGFKKCCGRRAHRAAGAHAQEFTKLYTSGNLRLPKTRS